MYARLLCANTLPFFAESPNERDITFGQNERNEQMKRKERKLDANKKAKQGISE